MNDIASLERRNAIRTIAAQGSRKSLLERTP